MRIAVCDDEKEAILYLVKILKKQEKVNIVNSFENQKEFLKRIRGGEQYDIVFMGIEWKNEIDGIQLSKILYDISPLTQIIYVTGFNDRFSQQIFMEESNLCGYLVKPVEEELMVKLLAKAQRKNIYTEEKLVVRQKGIIHAIPINEICYLESKGHYVIIHTFDKQVDVYGRLDDFKDKLPTCFLQCHKSYVVNMNYILFIDKKEILLKGEHKVSVSRAKQGEVRERYFQYMGE